MADEIKCQHSGCDKPARVAIKTTRPTRENLNTKVWWDERVAPKSAQFFCKQDGVAALTSLANTLIDEG